MNERAARLLDTVRNTADPNTNLDETEGEFLHWVGLKYMRADADGSKRIAELRGGSGDRGPSLGRTASSLKPTASNYATSAPARPISRRCSPT